MPGRTSLQRSHDLLSDIADDQLAHRSPLLSMIAERPAIPTAAPVTVAGIARTGPCIRTRCPIRSAQSRRPAPVRGPRDWIDRLWPGVTDEHSAGGGSNFRVEA